jgi:hypothetical protein
VLRACAAGRAPRPLRLRPQFGKGIGARPGEVVEQWYMDPQQYKGKTPGEAAQGKLVCDKLYELGILPAPSTWSTIGARVEFLVKEATAWETAYGTLDKIPTGGAKTTRVVPNADTGLDEEVEICFAEVNLAGKVTPGACVVVLVALCAPPLRHEHRNVKQAQLSKRVAQENV